jgi:hypothetical protein
MCPGSTFLADLARTELDRRTRWVAIAGESDRVVPDWSAGLHSASDAVTIRQRNAGHGSIARHPHVVSFIVDELLRAEVPVHQTFSLAA